MALATSVARKAGNYIACDAVNLLSGVSKKQTATTYARDAKKDIYNATSVPAAYSRIPFYVFQLPDETQDILTFQKQLIKLMLDIVVSDTTTSLIIYAAYWNTIDIQMIAALSEPLKDAGYEIITEYEFPRWKEENKFVKDIDIDDLAELDFVNIRN